MAAEQRVIVVGAGPVGLAAAAVLTGQGIPCLVLEKRAELSRASKASTFHPPTLEMLGEFGIAGRMLAKGIIADRIQYRTTAQEVVAEFDHVLLANETAYPTRVHLEQSVITPMMRDHILSSGRGELRFNTEVCGLGETETGAYVEVKTEGGPIERLNAAFVLGADGAHSAVREALGVTLDGEAYPGGVLRLVTSDPLEKLIPGIGQISYIFAPDGRSVSLLQMPGCWRIIIRLAEGFDEAAVGDPAYYEPILREFLPQLPLPVTLISQDIYRARKMMASGHGSHRIFLIGDALHQTNTRGGMNMNCGIHDAYAIGMAIRDALNTGRPEIAEAEAMARLVVAREQLLPRTDRNVRGGPDHLADLQARAQDPVAATEMLRRATMLDMAPPRRGKPLPEGRLR